MILSYHLYITFTGYLCFTVFLIMTFKAIYNMSPNYISNLVSVKSSSVYSLRSNSSLFLETVPRGACSLHQELVHFMLAISSFAIFVNFVNKKRWFYNFRRFVESIPVPHLHFSCLTLYCFLTRGVFVLFQEKRHIVYSQYMFQHVSDGFVFLGTRNCFIFLLHKEMFLLDFMRKNDVTILVYEKKWRFTSFGEI